jgi:valyl-tRNA synthetase
VSDDDAGPKTCVVCGRPPNELRQEDDIFDTWFSAGLWPISTLGWPADTEDLKRFYPTQVMETGWEIIFFWVARMMMMCEWLTGREPFHTVYLHGIVRDPYGAKMSKTKGNVVDPLDVVNEMGADAIRFALIHSGDPSADQRMTRPRLEAARNFANKLWNAARFVINARPADIPADAQLTPPDANSISPAEHWILHRCAQTVEQVERAYAQFQFGDVTRLLYDATWGDYCDWYLEIAKLGLAADAPAEQRATTWRTLTWVLDRYMRLLHPIMPHVTEEIWSRMPHLTTDPELLIVARWPSAGDAEIEPDGRIADGVAQLIDLITAIRTARAESGVAAADWLEANVWLPSGPARDAYPDMEQAVGRLARIKPALVARREDLETTGASAVAVISSVGEARLLRSEADAERERTRLDKELSAVLAQLASTEARLQDQAFVAKAPSNIVDSARARATELREQADALRARLEEN